MRRGRLIVGMLMVLLAICSFAHQAKYDTSRYVLNKAPTSLDGRHIKTTVFYAAGKFKPFLGDTFEDHFAKATFTCRSLVPSPMKPHQGNYSYQRDSNLPDVATINVTHASGTFKNLSYQTVLYFYSSMGGVFKIVQNKRVVATGAFFI